MKKYWNNKRVIITGASSGLGKALSLKLSQDGAQVVGIARGKAKLEQLSEHDTKINIIRGDISDKMQVHKISLEALTLLGGVDALFNVASYLGQTPLRNLMDTECEDMEKVLQTNLIGPFRFTKILSSEMIMNNTGLVVNISSDAALNAYPGWGSYSVSKIALDHLTRIFQVELANEGVKFLSIDPGDMDTPMHAAAIPDADPSELYQPEDSAKRLLTMIAKNQFTEVRNKLWNQE